MLTSDFDRHDSYFHWCKFEGIISHAGMVSLNLKTQTRAVTKNFVQEAEIAATTLHSDTVISQSVLLFLSLSLSQLLGC